MSIDDTVWLTPMAHSALERQLADLMSLDAPTAEEVAQRLHVSNLLKRASTDTKPDDGLVEVGMVVTIEFLSDGSIQTFLLAERGLTPDFDACSPDSPLGRAIVGLVKGAECTFEGPSGAAIAVRIVDVRPFPTAEEITAD